MSSMIGTWNEGPLVEAENLGFVYQSRDFEVVALRGLSLQVAEGEKIAITGSSGSGKTTFMNVLAGLERPSSGWLRVGTFDVTRLNNHEREDYRATIVGYCWQQSHVGLLSALSVLENVQVPMLVAGHRKVDKLKKSRSLLDALRLSHRVHDNLHRLTYVQRQRLAIAVALANDPLLLLADEPTASMDDTAAFQLLEDLMEILQDRGTAAVMVTHDQRLESYVDRSLHMEEIRSASNANRPNRAPGTSQARGYLGA